MGETDPAVPAALVPAPCAAPAAASPALVAPAALARGMDSLQRELEYFASAAGRVGVAAVVLPRLPPAFALRKVCALTILRAGSLEWNGGENGSGRSSE